MKAIPTKRLTAAAVSALLLITAAPAQATVRWSSFNDDCGPNFYLRTGPQGYSYNRSWDYNTGQVNTKNWGYVDYPYYRRSYDIPWWTTRQVYAEASLRWIELPYLVCL